MFLQSTFSKIALTAATGALAFATAATPALAATPTAAAEHTSSSVKAKPAHYKGRVIAKSGLLIRSGPSQKHKVVGALPYGTIVNIVCKVNGQNIDGNPRWYLLDNGKWAWGAARYIANIGRAPHWC
ncbi:SH3 domain-containing protein [Streptomyces sp. NPDC057702]|uniref:SH3 domain-containing protein n=1 Tax=unclassified Streptomyces TaxID=2593676 RepID=UPI0036B8719D